MTTIANTCTRFRRYLQKAKLVVLSFRGTGSLQNCKRFQNRKGRRARLLQRLPSPSRHLEIRKKYDENRDYRIVVGGHSIGRARVLVDR